MSSIEPDSSGREIEGSEKVACGLVIAGRDGAELLELTKEVLDAMACLVEVFVVGALEFTIRSRGNDGCFAGLRQRLEHPLVGSVAFIGQNNGCFQGGQ